MKIGIDARLIQSTGVGRYIRNLIRELSDIDTTSRYVVFLRKTDFDTFTVPNPRWEKHLADVPWHTLQEQIFMPWIFLKEHCDLLHVPYFNAPIFYPRKFIITIHDLTILHVDTGRASTLPYWLYKIRRLGYRLVLLAAIKRATRILTVSHVVKEDIMRSFGIADSLVSVTYEGVDDVFAQTNERYEKNVAVKKQYFLYVGNVFPHKNVELMIEAYHEYIHSVTSPAKLVFVGPPDFFYRRLEDTVKARDFGEKIIFLHDTDDKTLQSLYAHAIALVFPSRMEGFGLPALEALRSGCRVIVSDIPVFHEILGDFAVYADTIRSSHLAKTMKETAAAVIDRREFQKKTTHLLRWYSWSTMAKITRDIYYQFSQDKS